MALLGYIPGSLTVEVSLMSVSFQGSLSYVADELALGEFGPKLDDYSLGVVWGLTFNDKSTLLPISCFICTFQVLLESYSTQRACSSKRGVTRLVNSAVC